MDIQQFYRKYIPQHQLLLKKLPVFDLKNILKLPCNIDNIDSEKTKEELIDSTKKLREFMLVKEKTVIFIIIYFYFIFIIIYVYRLVVNVFIKALVNFSS